MLLLGETHLPERMGPEDPTVSKNPLETTNSHGWVQRRDTCEPLPADCFDPFPYRHNGTLACPKPIGPVWIKTNGGNYEAHDGGSSGGHSGGYLRARSNQELSLHSNKPSHLGPAT